MHGTIHTELRCYSIPILPHAAINGIGELAIHPKWRSVRPYVFVMTILLLIAFIVFLKPGPRTSQGNLQQ